MWLRDADAVIDQSFEGHRVSGPKAPTPHVRAPSLPHTHTPHLEQHDAVRQAWHSRYCRLQLLAMHHHHHVGHHVGIVVGCRQQQHPGRGSLRVIGGVRVGSSSHKWGGLGGEGGLTNRRLLAHGADAVAVGREAREGEGEGVDARQDPDLERRQAGRGSGRGPGFRRQRRRE